MNALVPLGLFLFAIAMPATIILRGYVLTLLWAWFIVPVFFLPALSIPAGLGISLIVSLLTFDYTVTREKRDGWEGAFTGLLTSFVISLFVLFLGWIVSLFMGGS